MTPTSGEAFLRNLRRTWWLVALITFLCVASAYAVLSLVTPRYTASAQLFVAAADSGARNTADADLEALYAGSLFTQDRVQSYVDIIGNTPVTEAAIKSVGANLTPSQLASDLSVDAPANTVLINVHVTNASPRVAQALANALARNFISFDASLERSSTGASPVKISISEPAALPTSPSSPNRRLDLALALLVGLVLAVGVAVGLDVGDKRLRDLAQLSEIVPLPVLAVIPNYRRVSESAWVVEPQEHSERAESFRHLRTSVQFINIGSPTKSLVVTSPQSSDGKTTVACNLAAVYADAGVRVLLVDADLRAPRVAHYFSLNPSPGLTDWLRDPSLTTDVVQTSAERPNLDIIASGPQPPNPSELLSSPRMHEILATLTAEYDVVIFDAPPILPVTDAAVLAASCDSVLLVTRARATRVDGILRSLETLKGVDARMVGVILNGSQRPFSQGSSYYYGRYVTDDDATRQLSPSSTNP
ncbi:MAG: polysaccharide biosynthesis tyrosine autokinase [Solirubrobacteraceae bacterium]